MAKNILIAYYSKTGTTKKVCEVLKMRLSTAEFLMEMKEFSKINSIESYDIVTIAAPINGMQWVEAAKQFVTDYEVELKKKKVLAIYVSYIIRHGNAFWRKKIAKGVESVTKAIDPIMIKDFGGVVDKEFPAFARVIFGIKKGTSPDASNSKEEIERFADKLAIKLVQ